MLQDAIGEYRKALGIYPNMADIRIDLGRLYLRAGQTDKAFHEFSEVLTKSPSNSKALVWAGIARLKSGRNDEARQFWRQAQAAAPGDPGARALVKCL
jgi:Flp pilus assembly protein TadD